jgi:hypothetical protein
VKAAMRASKLTACKCGACDRAKNALHFTPAFFNTPISRRHPEQLRNLVDSYANLIYLYLNSK